jgi:hypothetical protein
VADIANDGYFQTLESTFDFANRVHIQKALGRMFTETVTGVHNTGIDTPTQEFRRTARTMTNHHNVNTQGFEVLCGIQQCLTFTDGAGLPGELYNVSTQAAGGQSKAVSRAGTVFKKQIHYDPASERRGLLNGTGAYLLETLSGIKNVRNLFGSQFPQTK